VLSGENPTQNNVVVGSPIATFYNQLVINFSTSPTANYSFTYQDPNDPFGLVYDVRWAVITTTNSNGLVTSKRFILGTRKVVATESINRSRSTRFFRNEKNALPRRSEQGFSLIEMMIAAVIFILLCSAAFALLSVAQQRYQTESQVLNSFQKQGLVWTRWCAT